MSIKHAKIAAGPDIPGYEVVFSDWNADHVGSPLTVTDGTTSVADVTTIALTGAVVTDGGGGTAEVAVSGGSSPYLGTTPDAPIPLAPVDYLKAFTLAGEVFPATTYYDGPASDGVGATITENDATDGVLSVDGASPTVGQRVLWYSQGSGVDHGIYVVTDPGDGATVPFVLTRATDNDTIAKRCQFWVAGILSGTSFGTGSVRVTIVGTDWFDASLAGPYSNASGVRSTASGPYSTASGYSSTASGNYSTASGVASTASGPYSTASGYSSTASGYSSTASGYGSNASGVRSTASGSYSTASGVRSTASGYNSTASGSYSTASGSYSTAYSAGQVADTANHSRTPLAVQTTDDTPTPLQDQNGGNFTFQTTAQVADYTKTARVRGTVVARETDTPGTDSAWSFDGVIRGDGSTAYSWVGGIAPVATVIAQDAGATAWAVAVTITGASIVVTVTGAVATAITWACDLELVEVA